MSTSGLTHSYTGRYACVYVCTDMQTPHTYASSVADASGQILITWGDRHIRVTVQVLILRSHPPTQLAHLLPDCSDQEM